jgi:hypothetical protein
VLFYRTAISTAPHRRSTGRCTLSRTIRWIEMGRVRLVEGDAHQAEGCGRKALALASGDRSAQRQAGRVLADALRAQGRNPEAQAVESQPFMN